MDLYRRGNLVIGIFLLLVGAWFLAGQYFPQLNQFIKLDIEWPLLIVGIGLFFLIMSMLLRAPGLAVPASIIGGIGAIFNYQNQSGDWQSWAYMWTLIPGFVGVGVMLTQILEGRIWAGLREGINLILFSLLMFGLFSGFLGGPANFARLWPLFLIGSGVWMLLKNVRGRREERAPQAEVIEQ
jgi:hypothetical protein